MEVIKFKDEDGESEVGEAVIRFTNNGYLVEWDNGESFVFENKDGLMQHLKEYI